MKFIGISALISILVLISAGDAKKWAFFEKFDQNPSSPSQDLLPKTFGYYVTHRTHVKEHFTKKFPEFPGDHDLSCAGPDPNGNPVPQHMIRTSHDGTSSKPDPAFYICNGHLMSAMGEVSGYSIASFYPRQEWDFSKGGKLEFEVSNSPKRKRQWWEVLIVPRNLISVAAGPEWAPIEEHYPTERIAFQYSHGMREMQAGTKEQDPKGRIGFKTESNPYLGPWHDRYPDDPSVDDRRLRIRHRIKISKKLTKIQWLMQKPNGKWEKLKMKLKPKLPFTKGVVIFKTHSYTPIKGGNMDDYTDHWDNIRFNGPVTGKFNMFAAEKHIYLQKNGNVEVGKEATNTIDIPSVGKNPILFGQVHQPVKGEVMVSINGAKPREIRPYSYTDGCTSIGWKSFQTPVSPSDLKQGINTFRWIVGKRTCTSDLDPFVGFSIKSLELHFDA